MGPKYIIIVNYSAFAALRALLFRQINMHNRALHAPPALRSFAAPLFIQCNSLTLHIHSCILARLIR
jgi:hypothetical protein